jgi:SAM-dependent methyltransferase
VLELNCGTGADALFFAEAGRNVLACDGSQGMIEHARQKLSPQQERSGKVEFRLLSTELLCTVPEEDRSDGVFSNFSGLNCVKDLKSLSGCLAARLAPGSPLLLCFSTRYCLWEIAYYLLKGDARKAFRRCGGSSLARLGGYTFPVFYPTLTEIRAIFAPHFRFVSVTGIGVTVPPSYLEGWVTRHPRVLKMMERIDVAVRTCPLLRVGGDHMLVHLVRA